MRWGLVLVSVLVGTVGLSQLLGWYFDPMRTRDGATFTPPPPAPRPRPGKPAPVLPPPTREELALLDSLDPGNQRRGAELLLTRATTADVVTAVEAALQRLPEPAVEARLVCVKSRFEGPDILEFLLARFPRDRRELEWNLKPEVLCVLDALVGRVMDAPDRIVPTLMPAIYSTNGSAREKVLRAFRTIDVDQVPPTLLVEASTSGGPNRSEALAAAVALGAIRHNPALIARAVTDPQVFPVVASELRSDPHPHAARIVANVWAERSFESKYEQLARDREGRSHDVSAALVEIMIAAAEPELKRVRAAEHLGKLGEVGALRDLRAVASTEAIPLKSSAERAIQELQEQRKRGTRDQMRVLPPPQ